MMKKLLVLGALVLLSACTHRLELQQRGGSMHGFGTAKESDKSVVVTIGEKTYRGSYVFASGGSQGMLYGANNRGKTVGMFGSSTGVGGGSIIARSADGAGLRCQFQYSTTNSQGLGECQDDSGKLYDLQITMGG